MEEKPYRFDSNDRYVPDAMDILRHDVYQREIQDPIFVAYCLAEELHGDGQVRGARQMPYMNHPLIVYGLVRRCLDKVQGLSPERKNIILAAALLHDGIEDYQSLTIRHTKDERGEGLPLGQRLERLREAREKAKAKIREAYIDQAIAEKVIALVDEMTNPLEWPEVKRGHTMSKEEWQVHHASNPQVSDESRLIKICDQIANLMTMLDGPSRWNLDKSTRYNMKAKNVVECCEANVRAGSLLSPAALLARRMFEVVHQKCEDVYNDFMKNIEVKLAQITDETMRLAEYKKQVEETRDPFGTNPVCVLRISDIEREAMKAMNEPGIKT